MLLLRQIYGFKLPTVRENQTKYVSIIIQLFFCNSAPHAYPSFRSMDIILPIILFVTKFLWKYAYWIEMWDAKNTSQATTFITLPLTTSLLIWNEKSCGYNMFLSTRFFLFCPKNGAILILCWQNRDDLWGKKTSTTFVLPSVPPAAHTCTHAL